MQWDYIIIGSGFGGSVSALRLVEKGYSVLMVEKGRRFTNDDFPKTNWDLKRWMWLPALGLKGLFKMTFLDHITALSGVGVGGGSLVYGNTLPVPKDAFFEADSWRELADWKNELRPHYDTVGRMLGAVPNPHFTDTDEVLRQVAKEYGREEHFGPNEVAVYFGESQVTVDDPYFDGEGPARTGCRLCCGCFLGCRYDAKNTLDKNYLYLAEKRGLTIEAESEVTWVRQCGDGTFELDIKEGIPGAIDHRSTRSVSAKKVIFAGGVLGTLPLLLKLKESPYGLPQLSPRVGDFVRTNSEVLMGVVSRKKQKKMSSGIAISSIFHADDHSHVEPCRYPEGAGFFRTMVLPHAAGETLGERIKDALSTIVRQPVATAKALTVADWAKQAVVLLYMETHDGHLSLRLGRTIRNGFTRGLKTTLAKGKAPAASIPRATEIGKRVAKKVDGYLESLLTETLFGIPTTAHILGGCCMGERAEDGVIDAQHRVHGYPGLYVIDGAAVSANPGVNPSRTIAALAERAMTYIPAAG
jgi:cholesterol oxidase